MYSILSFFFAVLISMQSIFYSWLLPKTFSAIAAETQSAVVANATNLANAVPPSSVSTTAQVKPTMLLEGFNISAPTIFGNVLFVGGFEHAQQSTSSVILETTRDPESNRWLQPHTVFSIPGYSVGDPSVVQDNNDGYLLFFTKTANAEAQGTSSALKNQIGMAQSIMGDHWTDEGLAVAQENGIDSRGGWSPSALVTQNEIWLYYTTNGPGTIQVYRSRFDLSGKIHKGTDRVFYGATTPLSLFNVDVSVQGSKYAMYANSSLTSIVRYVSDDGIHWSQPANQVNPIITSSDNSIIGSPFVQAPLDAAPTIYFSGGTWAAKRWSSINQVTPTDLTTTPVAYSDTSASHTQKGVSDSGSTAESTSSSSSNLGVVGAVGLIGVAAVVAYSLYGSAATVAAPAATKAASSVAALSFGGRIVYAYVGCLNAAVFITIVPAGGDPNPFYVWIPTTITYSAGPPRTPGQQVLGLAWNMVYPCVVSYSPYVALTGQPMMLVGTSPI